MKKPFRTFLRDSRGIAAIEIAFIMPFMLMLYFGLADLTSVISLNRKVTYSADVVADLVTRHTNTVLKADIADYYNGSDMIMAPVDPAAYQVEIFGYRMVGTTVTQIWKTSDTAGGSCGAAPSTTAMAPLMVSGNDLILTRVCSTYTPYMASFLGTSILGTSPFVVSESNTRRPRSSLQLTCYQTTIGGAVCS